MQKILQKVSLVRFKEYAKPNNFFLTLYQDKSMEYKEPPKIRVVVRKRPLTSKELKKGDQDTMKMNSTSNLIV